jgi:hypothetical protein
MRPVEEAVEQEERRLAETCQRYRSSVRWWHGRQEKLWFLGFVGVLVIMALWTFGVPIPRPPGVYGAHGVVPVIAVVMAGLTLDRGLSAAALAVGLVPTIWVARHALDRIDTLLWLGELAVLCLLLGILCRTVIGAGVLQKFRSRWSHRPLRRLR